MKKNKKENREKTVLLSHSLGSLLLTAAGLVLVLNPDFGSATVAAIIGWVLVAVSALGILACILSWPVLGGGTLAACIAGEALGVYILVEPTVLVSILGIALGAWTLVQGASNLWEGLQMKKMGFSCWPQLILAGAMAAFGLFLLFYPLSTSRLLMRICGGIMMVCGIANLCLRSLAARRREKPVIIDAEP